MSEQEIIDKYTEICALIYDKHLKEAFDLLTELVEETKLGNRKDELHLLNTNYKYMLQYTLEGAEDPERERVYKKIQADSIYLAQCVREELLIEKSHRWIYEKLMKKSAYKIEDSTQFLENIESFHVEQELISLVEQSTISFEKLAVHHSNLNKLFMHIVLSDAFTENDIELYKNTIASKNIKVEEKCIFISALTLGTIHFFDRNKLNLLFDIYEYPDTRIRQRALVGILLTLFKYDKRIALNPKLVSRFALISDTLEFKHNFENILLQLVRSKDTEKIQRKIQDEILPEMVKIKPNLNDKLNMDDLLRENTLDDKNPDWEEIFQDSPNLLNRMQELTERQMEGDDIFMGSFSMLKQYPFFSSIENWFFPFDLKHHDILKEVQNDSSVTKVAESLAPSSMLCNSDKYSFCFSIASFPEEYKGMMIEGLEAQINQSEEIEKDEKTINTDRTNEIETKQYLEDLYRFFKLFSNKSSFDDIFNWKMDFHNISMFLSMLKENKSIFKNVAEFYFAKNYFEEAGECFDLLLDDKISGNLLQKRAFCFQKEGNYKQALKFYLQAELYDVNKIWNLKKIALCYRHCNDTNKALEYYRLVEQLDSEDITTQISIGNCLIDLENYEEALKCFFKVEYLNPESTRVFRPIGWCSFVVGKFEQAEKYYSKIIELEHTSNDYINLGHVYWCTDQRTKALQAYKNGISIDKSGLNFFEIFAEDRDYIISHGIKKDEIPIILDQLRYWLEE